MRPIEDPARRPSRAAAPAFVTGAAVARQTLRREDHRDSTGLDTKRTEARTCGRGYVVYGNERSRQHLRNERKRPPRFEGDGKQEGSNTEMSTDCLQEIFVGVDVGTAGGGTFVGGGSYTVTATPNSGHTFVHWTENGRVVSTSESYTFTLSSNITLVADFTAPKQYTIKVNASPSADGTVSGAGTFVGGSSQSVTATPNSGHTFVHWTENGKVVSTSESYTFTLSANVTLVADFK
jgi:Divergent InlB B-repeat domain